MPLQKHRYHRTGRTEDGIHRLSRLQTFSFETRTNSTPIIRLDSVLRLNHNNNTTESLDSLIERASEGEAAEEGNDTNSKQDPNLVTWDGPYDIENPLNWSASRKWTATILVSCFTFISPFSSTMVTPALEDIGDQYDIPEGFARALVLSIFLLGFAQGPFVLAPLSELFGRVKVLQWANVIYLVFNTVCPFAKTKEQLYLFRFLSGIGGSAPQALCNGVLADCWRKEERGKGQAIYGMLTFISPTVAPIMGAYVVDKIYWGWIFWITSIFDLLVQTAAYFFLRETYAPKILGDKAKKLRKVTGNPDLRTEYDNPDRSYASILYAYYQRRYNTTDGLPEWRIPPMIIGGIIAPAGLFLYGWSAQNQLHWAVPNTGCFLLATGLIIAFQSAQAYVTDAYDHRHAASAAAVGAFMRTMAGFGFPLFAPRMYEVMGLGWGNTFLGFMTVLIGIGSPAVLWFYGEKLRSWSTKGL
ncbi:putative mfs multidrug transporter [Diaporthe ampelina]|uniref:Putative mfs multidrug transporter n=1 Tax=Diaporthe ampelina TaxID=1214573 RepID=A0A0G2F7N6_9PEZI|nr:putative mfs multidrug transporter [Diaporthe ampelina]